MTIQNRNFQSHGTLYQAFGALKKVEVTSVNLIFELKAHIKMKSSANTRTGDC